jgi:hypothetical protein
VICGAYNMAPALYKTDLDFVDADTIFPQVSLT